MSTDASSGEIAASSSAFAGGGASVGTGGSGGAATGAGGSSGDGGGAAEPLPPCPSFGGPALQGLVLNTSIKEASGLAASRKNPSVLYVHNDSGDSPRVFAMNSMGGYLATYAFGGAKATDWEDIAVGPGPTAGESYLYVGDIGDNGESRDDVRIYRVAEPKVDAGVMLATLTLDAVETFTFVYPDGPHNAETLLVDPLTGDVHIVVKDGGGTSPVFRAKAPLSSSGKTTLKQIASFAFGQDPLPGGKSTTGGDISPDGSLVAVRTYTSAFAWRRAKGATIEDALKTAPCKIPISAGGQGETLGFAADGKGYFSLNEGTFQPLNFYAKK